MSYILVIGSSLIDVVATHDSSEGPHYGGNIHYSLGGVACNIATNLAVNKIPVKLFTHLSENSFASQVIWQSLAQVGLTQDYILHSNTPHDATFIGILSGPEFQLGVTSRGTFPSPLSEDDTVRLKTAIDGASVVVIDTNLETDFIRQIFAIVPRSHNGNKKRILATIVSGSKAKRIHNQSFNGTFEVVSMNEEEASSLEFSLPQSRDTVLEKQCVKDFCKSLCAKRVYITQGANGYSILDAETGSVDHKVSWYIDNIVNELGAGDALFSALCAGAMIKSNDWFNEKNHLEVMQNWVSRVLQERSANMSHIRLEKVVSTIAGSATPFPPFTSQPTISDINYRKSWFSTVAIILCLLASFVPVVLPSAEAYPNPDFWIRFVLCYGCAGALGTISKGELLKTVSKNKGNIDTTEQFSPIHLVLGFVTGLMSTLGYLLPHLASSDALSKTTDNPTIPTMILIQAYIIAFISGLSYEFIFNVLAGKSMSTNNLN